MPKKNKVELIRIIDKEKKEKPKMVIEIVPVVLVFD
jgi:hypothetical protein